jgi:membrane-associated protease RseP (regulator of RpoE activity)
VTVLAWVLGVVLFVLGLGASIALHEIGHLVPAKKFGVKVTQYMVGFGPTVRSRRRGETEYGVKMIPLGGYIRMVGMFPPKAGADPRFVRASSTGRLGLLVDEARQQSLDEIMPGDEHRVFYRLSVPRKVVVMMGGPVMNLVIGVVLLTGIITAYGVAVAQPGAVVAAVSECVLPATVASSQTVCAAGDPRTPAAAAGLRAGDKLISVGGQPITSTSQVGDVVRSRVGVPVPFVVQRAGSRLTLMVTPVRNTVVRTGADGLPLTDSSGAVLTQQAGFIGISSAQPSAIERQPISVVPSYVGTQLKATAGVILRLPQKMVGVAQAAFGSGPRDPNGPISIVGVGRVAGEVASSDQIAGVTSSGDRIAFFLSLLASLNFALFVFNLVPLLPLDGGHVAGALWEGLRRSVARMRRLPDPGPADVARMLPIAYVVSSLLVVTSVLLAYADIVKPVRLGG